MVFTLNDLHALFIFVQTFYFIPLVFFAYTFGLLATLLFESPFLILLKLAFASSKPSDPTTVKEEIVLQQPSEKQV